MSSTPDPAGFVGDWAIDRDLTDLRAGCTGRFTGRLTVAADRAGYAWLESGTLTWGTRTLPAERRLSLRPVGGAWWVCFGDGRRFHPWQFGEGVVHRCVADVYRGRLEHDDPGHDRRAPDRFTISWDVTGPAKRQLIVSRMSRPAPGPGTGRP